MKAEQMHHLVAEHIAQVHWRQDDVTDELVAERNVKSVCAKVRRDTSGLRSVLVDDYSAHEAQRQKEGRCLGPAQRDGFRRQANQFSGIPSVQGENQPGVSYRIVSVVHVHHYHPSQKHN